MAYTPSPLRTESGKTNFNSLVVDANRVAMVGTQGSTMQTQDATSTPVLSPLTLTGAVQTLTVPQNAVQLTIDSANSIVNVSEDQTMSVYFAIPIGRIVTIDVARQQYVYISGTGSNQVRFYFNMV